MMGAFEKVFDFFTPPDFEIRDIVEINDVDRLQKANRIARDLYMWRWKVTAGFLIGALLIIWAITPWGVVLASDIQKKMDSTTKPIKEDVAEVKSRLSGMELQQATTLSAVNELLSQKIAIDICRDLSRIKSEHGPANKMALRIQVDAHQNRYRTLTSEYYPESRCQ